MIRLASKHLLAGCTALDGLQLEGIYGVTRIVFSRSNKLRTIGVSGLSKSADKRRFQVLVIVNAPCLERIIALDLEDYQES